MILIVTSGIDDEAGQVGRKLKALKVPHFRLNCDRLHDLYHLSVDLVKPWFEIRHRKTGARLTSDQVQALWWQRPELPGEAGHPFPPYLSDFIDDEYYCTAISLLAVLEARQVPVINHPVRHNLSGHKSFQQRLAAACGFDLPAQLITGDAAAFLRQPWAARAVFKPVSNSRYVDREGQKLFVTVRAIDDELLTGIRSGSLPLHVHHFQERLEVQQEYRVTAFGDEVFAFRIMGAPDFDWRTQLGTVKYEREKPFRWSRQCLRYMKALGIRLGCFDLVLTREGRMVFLECNAPGYFLFCDPVGRHGLAMAFARYLKKLRPGS